MIDTPQPDVELLVSMRRGIHWALFMCVMLQYIRHRLKAMAVHTDVSLRPS